MKKELLLGTMLSIYVLNAYGSDESEGRLSPNVSSVPPSRSNNAIYANPDQSAAVLKTSPVLNALTLKSTDQCGMESLIPDLKSVKNNGGILDRLTVEMPDGNDLPAGFLPKLAQALEMSGVSLKSLVLNGAIGEDASVLFGLLDKFPNTSVFVSVTHSYLSNPDRLAELEQPHAALSASALQRLNIELVIDNPYEYIITAPELEEIIAALNKAALNKLVACINSLTLLRRVAYFPDDRNLFEDLLKSLPAVTKLRYVLTHGVGDTLKVLGSSLEELCLEGDITQLCASGLPILPMLKTLTLEGITSSEIDAVLGLVPNLPNLPNLKTVNLNGAYTLLAYSKFLEKLNGSPNLNSINWTFRGEFPAEAKPLVQDVVTSKRLLLAPPKDSYPQERWDLREKIPVAKELLEEIQACDLENLREGRATLLLELSRKKPNGDILERTLNAALIEQQKQTPENIPKPESVGDIHNRCEETKANNTQQKGMAEFFFVPGIEACKLFLSPFAEGAIAQGASQGNFLEAPDCEVVPVSRYRSDPTQGPQLALTALFDTYIRHAAVKWGGLKGAMDDILNDFAKAEGYQEDKASGFVRTFYKNGYLELWRLNSEVKERLTNFLESNIKKLCVLAQPVICEGAGKRKNIPQTHFFSFAPSFQGANKEPDNNDEKISTTLLVAQYVALAELSILESITKGAANVMLTRVGQGAFRTPTKAYEAALTAYFRVVRGFNVRTFVHGYGGEEHLHNKKVAERAGVAVVELSGEEFMSGEVWKAPQELSSSGI